MFKPNTLFYSDGYKASHFRMLAKGTTRLAGTWIPRTTKYAPKEITKIVSFGQQLVWKWLHDEFEDNFFNANVDAAYSFGRDMSEYLGMPYDAQHFEDLRKLGYLPIRVKSLPEGIETVPNITHMTFINTVDGYAWLTLYLETIVSSLAWKSSTSATLALRYKRNVVEWVTKTDPANSFLIPFLCHDFSARGLDPFSMLASGLGHATSFRGSDTLIVIPGARYFYGEKDVCINSVNASEHSVSCTKIFAVGEKQMIIDWLKGFPSGILSIVADTFDLWKLITEYLTDPEVKELILARDGKLVIRPDSGDPVDIICGTSTKGWTDISKYFPEGEVKPEYFNELLQEDSQVDVANGEPGPEEFTGKYIVRGRYYEATIHNLSYNRYDKQYYYLDMWEKAKITFKEISVSPAMKGVVELLWDIFGGTVNEQGYKVLDSHIGAIYGDSINLERQVAIYSRLGAKGFASTNIVLGVGSFTYQFNTRDTFGFAAKGSWFEVCRELPEDKWHDGMKDELVGYDIYKDPITDDGTKKSLKGLVAVHQDSNGEYFMKTQCTAEEEKEGVLQVIYEDGKFFNATTLTDIRNRLNQ